MSDRLLTSFRVFLILWSSAIVAHFVYVQSVTDWGRSSPDTNFANPWDQIYFGVLNAAFVVVPFLVFQLPIARRFGGWSSSIGRALLAYGIGTVLWGFGNFYWFVKNVQGDEAPYPSLADAGYLAVLPFAAWALWELSKVVGLTRRDWRWLPIALVVAFPLNAWIMLPQGIGAGTFDTAVSTAISTTYILCDVVLLGVAILVALGARRAAGGRFLAPVLAVTASIVLLYVGDLFFNYRIANDTFYNADISDLLYGMFIVSSSWSAYLFLAADVRATAAVAAEADAWHANPSLVPDAAAEALPPLVELTTAILRGQSRMMGRQTAHAIAAGVSGIEIDEASDTAGAVDVVAVDALVREYRAISGPLGEMTCWTAARPVLARHADLTPDSLARFVTARAPQAARSPSSPVVGVR